MRNSISRAICAFSILVAAPVFAHDFLQQDRCERLLEGFGRLEAAVAHLSNLVGSLPPELSAQLKLDQAIIIPARSLKADVERALNEWNPDDTAASDRLLKDLVSYERKAARYSAELELWMRRLRARNFEDVRKNPMLLMPDRIYKVKSDRGEEIQVRFSHKLLEEFFWEEKNKTVILAAEHAVEAVARGYQPTSAKTSSGIGMLQAAIGGRAVYKIKMVGGAIGAYRVYGLATNGVIGFVTQEASDDHDAKYLRRAIARAINAYESLGW